MRTSALYLLFFIILLTAECLYSAPTSLNNDGQNSSCESLFNTKKHKKTKKADTTSLNENSEAYNFPSVDFLSEFPPEISTKLKEIGIGRPNLFSTSLGNNELASVVYSELHDLTIGKPKVHKTIIAGMIYGEQARGVVAASVAPEINPQKSLVLLKNIFNASYSPLQKNLDSKISDQESFNSGEVRLFQYIDDVHFENSGVKPDTNTHFSDHDFIETFIKKFNYEIAEANGKSLIKSDLDYVRMILSEMSRTGRLATGNRDLHIRGIRARWKSNGRGNDFDQIHRDQGVLFTSTFAAVGNGTEFFYFNDDRSNTIEAWAGQNNTAIHLLGGRVPIGVLHRASTNTDGPRLVFLIFWN